MIKALVFGLCFAAIADELPIVDLSADTWRQTVVAAGTEEIYQGHPTTLLAANGRTMFCTWTYNHGGSCGPFARSDDAGLTWKRIDLQMPASYKNLCNCPTLQTVPRPDGGTNFCVYAYNGDPANKGGLGIMYSSDQGETWNVIAPAKHLSARMPPTGLMSLKDGTVALFGQVRTNPNVRTDRAEDDQDVWMSISNDGGFTWGAAHIIAHKEKRNLCEPFAIRSPDGREIALLMRENRHKSTSMVVFSSDEGKTWTEPVDTSWGLTGDRHEGIILPDGRYVIAFRDQAIGSSTHGQYVAWIGTWDDLRNSKKGICRVHLLKHYPSPEYKWSKFDTGYSGVELLDDGTIVCTTYSKHWNDKRKQSVVSMRFNISEIDAKLKK